MAKKSGGPEINKKLESLNIEEKFKVVDEIYRNEGPEGLIKLLESRSWHVREKAFDLLLKHPDICKKHIEQLVKGKYWYVRYMGVKMINELGLQEEYAEILEKFSKDENIEIREEAIKGLDKLGKKEEKE